MDWTLKKEQPWIRLAAAFLIVRGTHDLIITILWLRANSSPVFGDLWLAENWATLETLLFVLSIFVPVLTLIPGILVFIYRQHAKNIIIIACAAIGLSYSVKQLLAFLVYSRLLSLTYVNAVIESFIFQSIHIPVACVAVGLVVARRNLSGRRFLELTAIFLIADWGCVVFGITFHVARGLILEGSSSLGLYANLHTTLIVGLAFAIFLASILLLFNQHRGVFWTSVIAACAIVRGMAFFYALHGNSWRFLVPRFENLVNSSRVYATILMYPGLVWFVFRHIRTASDMNCCSNCDYNLTGNLSGVCPECGTTIEATAASTA